GASVRSPAGCSVAAASSAAVSTTFVSSGLAAASSAAVSTTFVSSGLAAASSPPSGRGSPSASVLDSGNAPISASTDGSTSIKLSPSSAVAGPASDPASSTTAESVPGSGSDGVEVPLPDDNVVTTDAASSSLPAVSSAAESSGLVYGRGRCPSSAKNCTLAGPSPWARVNT